MSRLRIAFERYIGMRQGLGYKYDGPAKRLSEFVAFMETRGAETITNDLAMQWVNPMGRQPSWSIRLADVRCFAQQLTHFDPLTEVPPSHAVAPARRTKPYIYSEIEIQALLAAALSLPPANALRRWTYHCLFGLIAVAGLRHSEALSLLRADVDLDQGVLPTALFPNMHGGRLSADGVQALLNKFVAKAREHCISLRSKRVSPPVLRHSAAMELLQAGVDCRLSGDHHFYRTGRANHD